MTPDKLAKIRALAEDVRGDPATRAIAQAALKRYTAEQPQKTDHAWKDPRHPGMRPGEDYERYRFMDMGTWRTTANGNQSTLIVRNGRSWRIVLFRHKKSPTWGWMRIDTVSEETEFSGKFATMGEAHRAAWEAL